ncbi:MAG: glycosyltransferase family 4 protein [Chloroflexi bacterium]|nr:glycosyltransferase family 4 protein [Chloroflexota bacterium]
MPESPVLTTGKRYNVLKIAPTSFFSDYGCHVRIYEESLALRRLGNGVTVCTYHTGGDIDGLDIRRSLRIPWDKKIRVGSSMHKLYCDALLSLRALHVSLQFRPDIIHAHLHEGALIGYYLSRLRGIPLVFDFQGSLTSEMIDHNFIRRNSRIFGPLRFLESHINGLADAVITSSRHGAEVLRQDFEYPLHKVFTVPDGVDASFFRPRSQLMDNDKARSLRQSLGIPLGRKVVVYLGLLAPYQGTNKLLEAASLLVKRRRKAHFLVMGYPGEDYYRALAADMGLTGHVTFTGRIPYRLAPGYLALGDIAVAPKLSETEGNGKLLNYIAAGLPTVAFDTPVAREILGDLGVYARPGCAESLANDIDFLLTADDALMWEFANRLRARAVNKHSWDLAGKRLMAIYDYVST